MMSASGFAVAAAVGAPLVIDAGWTPATAATAGSINCRSMNRAIPAIMSARTRASAEGDERRASSSVIAMIPATFDHVSETDTNARAETGFGFASPTQL